PAIDVQLTHYLHDTHSFFLVTLSLHDALPICSIRKKLADYDWEGFMVELNSAVGTLENEKKEERLEELITQLSQYPEALGDYREKLKKKGIETDEFRPMGSAEGTM